MALLSATFLAASFLFFFFMNLFACRVVRFIRNSGSPYYRVEAVADLGTGVFVGIRCPALISPWNVPIGLFVVPVVGDGFFVGIVFAVPVFVLVFAGGCV